MIVASSSPDSPASGAGLRPVTLRDYRSAVCGATLVVLHLYERICLERHDVGKCTLVTL